LQSESFSKNQKVGRLLIEAGLITEAVLEEALAYQERNEGILIGKALVETGGLTGREIAGTVAVNLAMPYMTLDNVSPSSEILALVPAQIALTHVFIPVLKINKTLVVAVSNPFDAVMTEELSARIHIPVHMAVAPEDELVEAVLACYPSPAEAQSSPRRESAWGSREKKAWAWPERQRPAGRNQGFNIFGINSTRNRHTGQKTGGDEQSEKAAGQAPAGSGNTEAVEQFEKGLAAVRKGDYQEALAAFEAALALDPKNRACRANIQRIKKVLADQSAN
jgi:tetratricopeptide (TPR) repeat protein